MQIKNEEYGQYIPSMVPPAAETAVEHHDREHTEPEFPEQAGVHDNAPVHICIVHGCGETLFKAYDRKCRACFHHRQMVSVDFGEGLHHRFCQKCSRFHLLSEFDDLKRTCRQRLSQHNCRQRRLRMLRKAAQNDYSIQMAHIELSASLPVSTELLQHAAPSTIIFLNRPQTVLNLSESAGLNFFQSPELNDVCFPLAPSSGGCIPSQPEGPTNSMRFVAAQATPTTLYQAQLGRNCLGNSAGQIESAAKEPMELEEFIWLEQCLAQGSNKNNNFGLLPVGFSPN